MPPTPLYVATGTVIFQAEQFIFSRNSPLISVSIVAIRELPLYETMVAYAPFIQTKHLPTPQNQGICSLPHKAAITSTLNKLQTNLEFFGVYVCVLNVL